MKVFQCSVLKAEATQEYHEVASSEEKIAATHHPGRIDKRREKQRHEWGGVLAEALRT